MGRLMEHGVARFEWQAAIGVSAAVEMTAGRGADAGRMIAWPGLSSSVNSSAADLPELVPELAADRDDRLLQ